MSTVAVTLREHSRKSRSPRSTGATKDAVVKGLVAKGLEHASNRRKRAERRARRIAEAELLASSNKDAARQTTARSDLANNTPRIRENELVLPWVAESWLEKRSRFLRGKRVLLESDLAAALGVTEARLRDVATRHPDWFSENARFTLSVEECRQLDLWWMRHGRNPWKLDDNLPIREGLRPQTPSAYSADGVVAAAHWIATEASWLMDSMCAPEDLHERFQIVWKALRQAS